MEENSSDLKSIVENIEAYSKTSFDLFKLKMVDKIADIISGIASYSVLFVFILMFFLIGNIALALWLGELSGKLLYGFLMLTGLYAGILLLFILCRRKWIKEPIANTLIRKLLND